MIQAVPGSSGSTVGAPAQSGLLLNVDRHVPHNSDNPRVYGNQARQAIQTCASLPQLGGDRGSVINPEGAITEMGAVCADATWANAHGTKGSAEAESSKSSTDGGGGGRGKAQSDCSI